MASVITATNSSGLTTSADNSGVLQLASGTGNLVTVPSVTGTAMVSGNMPAFSAYASSTQSVTNLAVTKVTLDTEIFDTNNNFASSRFTPTVAGYYQLNGTIRTGASTVITNASILIYKNGSSYARGAENSSGKNNNQVTISSVVYLNGSTDYVELYGFVEGTSPSFNYNSADITSMFSGCLVRSA